jgi:hypothetical protein
MLEEVPFYRLIEWMAFDKIEPIGGARIDWAAASVAATTINVAAARGGSKRRVRPVDMILEYGEDKVVEVVKEEKPKTPSWQELKFTARMWVADSKAKQKKKR